jgi:hypothetical protein
MVFATRARVDRLKPAATSGHCAAGRRELCNAANDNYYDVSKIPRCVTKITQGTSNGGDGIFADIMLPLLKRHNVSGAKLCTMSRQDIYLTRPELEHAAKRYNYDLHNLSWLDVSSIALNPRARARARNH